MKDFETFYVTWYSRVNYFAREYVISEADAENITQDVFLAIYERRVYLDSSINIVGYLFTSVKNRCLDFLRKEIQKKNIIENIELELRLRFNYEALEEFDSKLLSLDDDFESVLNRALEKLPQKCREIFILSKLEGKKQKEIALDLNISINTVESQMGIAYKKLREELKDYMPLLLFLLAIN